MKNRFAALFLALLMLWVFVQPVRADETVTLAFGEWAPYHTTSLPGNGIGSTIYTEAFANVGIKTEFLKVPWKRAYELAKKGTVQGSMGWLKTDERMRDFYFSDPVVSAEVVLFHRKGVDVDWENPKSLKGLRLVRAAGDTAYPRLKIDGGRQEEVSSHFTGMKMLIAGRADLFRCNLDVGLYLLQTEFPEVDFVTYQPKPLREGCAHLIVSRRIPNGQALVNRFNEGLRQLRDSGRLSEIVGDFRTVRRTVHLTSGEWPPYYSASLPGGGLGARIVREAFAQEGVKVEYVYHPWLRALHVAQNGPAMGSAGWLKTKEREEHFLFSDALFKSKRVFFYRKDKAFDWEKIEDLKGLRVAVALGSAAEYPTLQDYSRVYVAPSYISGLKKLVAGRVDVYACNLFVGLHMMSNLTEEEAALITYHPKPIFEEQNHLILSKRLHDGQDLIELFNRGLQKMKESGRYDELIEESGLKQQ